MQNILDGIYAAYAGDATLKAALPGGLFLELASQTTSSTYATYTLIVSTLDYYLAETYFEVTHFQFDIYAPTNALRLAAYEALTDLYDNSFPAATGYSTIIMTRGAEQFIREGEQDEIYRAIVDYECRYQKN